jgi:TonB family protein
MVATSCAAGLMVPRLAPILPWGRKGSGDLPGLQSRRRVPSRNGWWIRLPHAPATPPQARLNFGGNVNSRSILLGLAILSFGPLLIAEVSECQEQKSKSIPSAPSPGMQVMSSTEGLDFGPYIRKAYSSINRSFHTNVTKVEGENGAVVLEFRIQKDGSLYENAIAVISSSGEKSREQAAIKAILAAAPFDPLPKNFTKPFILIRCTFLFKTHP